MLVPKRRNFFDDVFDDDVLFSKRDNKMMRTDIKEKGGNYIFTIDVPGVEKENIDIDLENGYLTVSSRLDENISDEEEGEYIYQERYSGECSRSFYVGDGIKEDDVKASFKNGILTISVPSNKQQKEEQKKHIQID